MSLAKTHSCLWGQAGMWVCAWADAVSTYQWWKGHWWISLSHTEIPFPSCLLHLAEEGEGSPRRLHGLRLWADSSLTPRALSTALQWVTPFPGPEQDLWVCNEAAQVWVLLRKHWSPGKGWGGEFGAVAIQSSFQEALPEVVCQLCSCTEPAQARAFSNICTCTGGSGLAKTGTFHMGKRTSLSLCSSTTKTGRNSAGVLCLNICSFI